MPEPTHTAQRTAVNANEVRIFKDVEVAFAHAFDGEEDFIPAEGDRPAQSRIFVNSWNGVIPMLIVKGSLKPIVRADD